MRCTICDKLELARPPPPTTEHSDLCNLCKSWVRAAALNYPPHFIQPLEEEEDAP